MSSPTLKNRRPGRWLMLVLAICIGVPMLIATQGCRALCRKWYPCPRETTLRMDFCYVPGPCLTDQTQICFDRWVAPVPGSIKHVWRGDVLTFKNNTRNTVKISLEDGVTGVFVGPEPFRLDVPSGEIKSVTVKEDRPSGFVLFKVSVLPPDVFDSQGYPSPGVDIDGP